ncbi:MAG TPA: hypothetical protein VIS54_03135 [Psychromonas sp.]
MNANNKILLRIVAVYLFLLGGPSHAEPIAEWTPQKLTIEQMQGALSSYEISVKLTENTASFVVELGPHLSKWVIASPASFEQASAGEEIKITLIINLPPDAPVQSFNGTVKLRSRERETSPNVLAKPLPVLLKIGKKVHKDKPNHPGKAGKETLLGIDKDNDGVRDDIQIYIAKTYPDEEAVRLALTEMAKQYQIILMQADVPDTALNNAVKTMRHGECLDYIKGSIAADMLSELRARMFNTKDRSIEYIKYSDSLGGEFISVRPVKDWKNSCVFDLDLAGGMQ